MAIFVRLFLGVPVLYRHQRPGLKGATFVLYKFRTMTDQRNSHGELLPDERRLTLLGRILRTTSLDELPQLWNVLLGQMSLVGPRPLRMRYLKLYTPEQMRRHDVKPGLTGWAQLHGRNAINWQDKFRLDVWYAHNHSFWIDLQVLMLTPRRLFEREDLSVQIPPTAYGFADARARSQEEPRLRRSLHRRGRRTR